MRRLLALSLLLLPATAHSQGRDPLVEFENMTWVEVKDALAAGKTTALYYTGGTEQRGPQNTNGGHNFMARATVKAILRVGRVWQPSASQQAAAPRRQPTSAGRVPR